MSKTLISHRKRFEISLIELYAKKELDAFFYIFCEQYLGFSRADIALNQNYELSEIQTYQFEELLKRLKLFEPIQYIIGFTTFYQMSFKVSPAVLIPRPETEELVDLVVKTYKQTNVKHFLHILDIGTGSGCIAISLAKNIQNSEVWAMDISVEALAISRFNAHKNQVNIHFEQQDVLHIKELTQKYDIIISNPPYVRTLEEKEMDKNVLLHEPALALFVTDLDPLIFYRKIGILAFQDLNEKGSLFFEINQYLALETKELLFKIGFKNVQILQDFLGNDRFIIASKRLE